MEKEYIPSEPLRVVGIKLTNIGIFDNYEIRPGDITLIEGDNEVGKTTIEQAIKAVFAGGNPARLITNGQDTGKIVMELSDGTIFDKTLSRVGTGALKEKHPEFGIVSAAQTNLNKMTDGVSVDPSKLLSAKPEERVKYFQSKLPIPLPTEELRAIIPAAMPYSKEGHTLSVLGTVRKQLEAARLQKRHARDEKVATVKELEKTIPPDGEVWDEDAITNKRSDLRVAEKALEDARTTIKSQREKDLKASLSLIDDEIAKGEKALSEEIERLRKKWDEVKSLLQQQKVVKTRSVNDGTSVLLEQATSELQPDIDTLRMAVGSLERQRDDQVRVQAQRDMRDKAQEAARDLSEQFSDYDGRIKRLDTLAESLTAELPIKGLTMQDGDLAFEGMPWEQLNTAKQVMLVFRIAEHCAGKLGIIFFDGLECLSAKTLELFRQEAVASGRQIFVTRVTEGPLRIRPLTETLTEIPH